MINVYRLSSSRFQANSGAGAALYGGRWNSVGTPAIYASASRSLAALEILVHYDAIPRDFVLTEIYIPDELGVLVLEEGTLPAGWDAEQSPTATQEIGDRWIRDGKHIVLSVPSSVVPLERNFVINPLHSGFSQVGFSRSVPFRFDPRLK